MKLNINQYKNTLFWPYRAALLVNMAGKRFSPYITDLYAVRVYYIQPCL